MKTVRSFTCALLLFVSVSISCKNSRQPQTMNDKYDSGNIEVKPSGFFLPPPISPNESAKTLVQWYVNQSKLCDTVTSKTICVFRLFKTPDKNYAIYLAFAKHAENDGYGFAYISSIGNSFQLSETASLTFDQILEKVAAEYRAFSGSNKQEAAVFEKAESVNATVDNYHVVKLHSR